VDQLIRVCNRALWESNIRSEAYLRGGLSGWWMLATLPLRHMPARPAPVMPTVEPAPVQTPETPLEAGRRRAIERRRAIAAANIERTSEILAGEPRISDEALAAALGVSQSTANRYKRVVRTGRSDE